MYGATQGAEWPRNSEQDQQRPLGAVRNTVNLGSTPMARPPPQQSNSNPAPYSRASSFFSSFRKNSKPDPVEPGSISPSTMSSGYSGHPNQAQQAPYTVGAAGQRRPDAGNWDEQGRNNSIVLANERPQASTQGRSGSGGPSKLISPRVQAVQAQSASHSPSNSMSSAASSIGRRGSSYMKTIATRNANGEIHSEIQQVVTLTLAHSSKIYCSGYLVRRLERNPDGTIVKDAKWVDVWAQLGGTTLSVWESEAIKKASEEGREEPPTYINVTDSVRRFIIPPSYTKQNMLTLF
jgi:CCR4-NOT transcriptional complex subunit CAF120